MITNEILQIAREQNLPLASVAAEVFHLIVLEAILAYSESQMIHFQGGTSIHLLYRGYRYSEDLDFAGDTVDFNLAYSLMHKSKSSIEKMAPLTKSVAGRVTVPLGALS